MIHTMREIRINGNRLIQAPALLELAKETYVSKGFDASYELVYNMFPDIPSSYVENILSGEIDVLIRGNTVIVFLDISKEIANG